MLFTYFAVPQELQKRVLMLGAPVLRAVMTLIGARLIAQFHWILYCFGAFLLFTSIKMLIIDLYKIPVVWLLSFTVLVLTATMLLSLRIPPREKGSSAYPFAAELIQPAVRPSDKH